MSTYPTRQGIDYGPRKGTLGLAFHMAEGADGTLAYLAKRATEGNALWRTRVRGVSANAVILTDGTVWNMVDWDNASGSMNPADRNPSTTGYYNGSVIKAVLGAHYTDPNAYSISVEICGFRAKGPTPAQVKAAIAWGLDMRQRFPTIRGAYGHHDQTDTKGCPGTTANMKAIFDGLGGHGLWPEEDSAMLLTDVRAEAGRATMTLDGPCWRVSDGEKVDVKAGSAWDVVGTARYSQTAADPDGTLGYMIRARATDGELHIVSVARVTFVAAVPIPPPTDCSAPIATAVKAATDPINLRLANANSRIQRAATDLGATPPAPI